MSPQSQPDADAGARVRHELTQALQAAKADLATLEENNQRAHFELQLMLRSREPNCCTATAATAASAVLMWPVRVS